MHSVDDGQERGDRPYVAGDPDDRDRDPAGGRPEDRPGLATAADHDTPLAVSSSGMTWASKAVSAGRSNPLATPVAKTTARIADSPIPPAAPTGRPAARRRP